MVLRLYKIVAPWVGARGCGAASVDAAGGCDALQLLLHKATGGKVEVALQRGECRLLLGRQLVATAAGAAAPVPSCWRVGAAAASTPSATAASAASSAAACATSVAAPTFGKAGPAAPIPVRLPPRLPPWLPWGHLVR